MKKLLQIGFRSIWILSLILTFLYRIQSILLFFFKVFLLLNSLGGL